MDYQNELKQKDYFKIKNMKKEITVTISGEPKTGKSRITYIIKEMLKVYDMEVEFNCGLDYTNEQEFNRLMRNNLENVMNNIKNNIKIIVKEERI